MWTKTTTGETPAEEIKRLERELAKAEQEEDFERCMAISKRMIHLIDLNKLI